MLIADQLLPNMLIKIEKQDTFNLLETVDKILYRPKFWLENIENMKLWDLKETIQMNYMCVGCGIYIWGFQSVLKHTCKAI